MVSFCHAAWSRLRNLGGQCTAGGGAAALPAKEPGEPLIGDADMENLDSGFGEFPRLQVQ